MKADSRLEFYRPVQRIGFTIALVVWLLGGVGLVLLFIGQSTDHLYPYRYLLIGVGAVTMLVPAIWLRTSAGTFRGMRRESLIEYLSRYTLFGMGVLALGSLALLNVVQRVAATTLLILIFESYFLLGTYVTAAILARSRERYYASHCPHCLYDLTAIESSTCPECGRVVTPFETDPS